MKSRGAFLLLILIAFASCVATKNKNYTFNQKYSATQVKADIILLKQIFEANHPSLYWYTPKDSIDYFFCRNPCQHYRFTYRDSSKKQISIDSKQNKMWTYFC